MTDAHFHRNGYDTFLVVEDEEFRFYGVHPWQITANGTGGTRSCASAPVAADSEADAQERVPPDIASIRDCIAADAHAGVGEIGLDRLKTKVVPDAQRVIFEEQLKIAAEFRRPVVLHGAKCWGEVVKACQPYGGRIPAFLFHGFSRSTGLLPDIFALNGFVSLGPALLNDHAVNYREMARDLPVDRLMIETDQDWSAQQQEQVAAIAAKLAELRKGSMAEIEAACVDNVRRFVETLA